MDSNARTGERQRAPSVSVVIPAYNAASYLPAALAGVARQTLAPLEVIVVDDGSSDDTAGVAAAFGARVISTPNRGTSAARNVGTQAARGDVVAYLDADDLWTNEKLEQQVGALAAFGQPAFSFTDYRLFDERGTHRRQSELRRHRAFRRVARRRTPRGDVILRATSSRPVLYESYIPPSSIMVRRADILAVGGFDESLRVTEDFELYLRLFTIVPAVAVMRALLLYRRHAGQATSDAARMKGGMIDVARLVKSTPERYPPADARYLAATEHHRLYQLGIAHARRGEFDAAALTLTGSIDMRWSARANVALAGARICRSVAGRRAFDLVQAAWKNRLGLR